MLMRFALSRRGCELVGYGTYGPNHLLDLPPVLRMCLDNMSMLGRGT